MSANTQRPAKYLKPNGNTSLGKQLKIGDKGLIQRKTAEKAQKKKVRILSIDGGGIRGILPATILAYLENRLQEKNNDPTTRLCDYFDFFAGTSTGGILVCSYLVPDQQNPNRPRYNAQQALNMYLKQGCGIFDRSWWRKIKSMMCLLDEKYDSKNKERALQNHLGKEARLSEFIKPCLLTAYNITERKAEFLTSASARQNPAKDYKVWMAARATAAAPIYFGPAIIQSETGETKALLDGGVFATNPALCAFAEAQKTAFNQIIGSENKPDFPESKDIMLVSIGTGKVKTPYQYQDLKSKGALHWLRPSFDIMMSANLETVDYQMQQLFDKNNYYRLRPEPGLADSAIDNIQPENLQALYQAGLDYIKNHRTLLEKIVDQLIEND